jgi:excisionase family DNA binding protein
MSETATNSFQPFFEEIRRIVREEIVALSPNKAGGDSLTLLSAEQAAKKFSVPKSWVLGSARRGELPCVKLGHYVRFEEKDLAEFLRQRKNGKALEKSP